MAFEKSKHIYIYIYIFTHLIIFTIQENKGIIQLSLCQKEAHVKIWNLIPIPNTRSNKFGDKAVKICSANTLARDMDILKKFSETK